MSNNDKFFLEEILGVNPDLPEPNGIEMLNQIADQAEVRISYMPDYSKVCSFCGETTKEMFPAFNDRFKNIGYCCSYCIGDYYCNICGEHPTEEIGLFAFEELQDRSIPVCEKCYSKIEEKDFNN